MAARVGVLVLVLALAACSPVSRKDSLDHFFRCGNGTPDYKPRGC